MTNPRGRRRSPRLSNGSCVGAASRARPTPIACAAVFSIQCLRRPKMPSDQISLEFGKDALETSWDHAATPIPLGRQTESVEEKFVRLRADWKAKRGPHAST